MRQYQKHLWSPDMEATYLSRSISKMLETEEPVGDPFGGAAYGCKEGGLKSLKKSVKGAIGDVIKPVANVIGEDGIKILALGAAVFTGGASLAAFNTLTFSSIAAGVAYAGATLSLVGTATGNQKLSKIGNTVALVGGVAAVATGGLAALQEPMNEVVKSAQNYYSQFVGSGAVETGQLTAGQTGVVNAADDAVGSFVQEVGEDAVENAAVQGAAGGGAPVSPSTVNPSGVGINQGVNDLSGAGLTGRPDSLGTFASKPVVSGNSYGLTTGTGTGISPSFNPAPVSSGLPSSNGFISGAMEFAKQNPTVAFLAGNTAVSAIGGAADARAEEEAAAKARQQELDDRQFLNDSINGYNLNYDYSNVQSPYGNQPITPGAFQSPPQMVYDPASQQYVPAQRPQQPQQPRQGLIANNMQRMA